MGKHRTPWHLLAATFIDERRPACVRLEMEVPLSMQPQRADLLLIRKDDRPVDDARAFFHLWRLMGPVALAEYKSRSRPPQPGVFHQLFGYGHQYAALRRPPKLSLFLMVPEITPTLKTDAAALHLELGPCEGAYTPVKGALFPTWIVTLNALADEEGEPLIGQLGSRTLDEEDRASWHWLAHFMMQNQDRVEKLEGYAEFEAEFRRSKLFKNLLAAMPVKERLEGVSIRELLAGLSSKEVAEALTAEQRYAALLSMSDNDLRELSDAFIDSLPESVRTEIRRRRSH